jgi:hypothetical protein
VFSTAIGTTGSPVTLTIPCQIPTLVQIVRVTA